MRLALACTIVIGCAVPGGDDDNRTSGTFADVMTSLRPVAYWRLGEGRGTTAVDVGGAIDGTYGSDVLLAQPGALAADPDTAIRVTGTANSVAVIPDHKVLSLTRVWDVFDGIAEPYYGSSWGAARDGQRWTAQVTTDAYYGSDGEHAVINETGATGAWQQGLPSTVQLDGDMQIRASWSVRASGGPLQPVALVAHYVDDRNSVRAELVENADHTLDLKLIAVADGASATLARATNIGTYSSTRDWWYVRFQFSGPELRARAWQMGTPQPTTWQVTATAASARAGSIAVRSANSQSAARPLVRFDDFWSQSLGFSIHLFWSASAEQTSRGQPIYLFGKGEDSGHAGDREFLLRYHPTEKLLKAYVNDWRGGFGAGQTFGCSDEGCSPQLEVARWYELVIAIDSGDALDSQAGLTFYVDGVPIGEYAADGGAGFGALYNGSRQCMDATVCDATSVFPVENCVPNTCGFGSALPAADGGALPANQCEYKREIYEGVRSCWNLYPMNGNAPLRLGSRDPASSDDHFFSGSFDELAVFSRKLSQADVTALRAAAMQ